jgi:hypothetical protein
MRSIVIFLFVVVSFASCDLGEVVEKAGKINADLESKFHHEHIDTSIGWGTEEGDDHVIVTFNKYDLQAHPYGELSELANKVRDRVLSENPELKKMDYIEVRFTDQEDTEDLDGFVSFKFRNSQANKSA